MQEIKAKASKLVNLLWRRSHKVKYPVLLHSFYFFFFRSVPVLLYLLLVVFMAQGGEFSFMNQPEGEQDTTSFMPLPPHQSTLLNELSSRFSNIDKKFAHLFECLGQKGYTDKQPAVSSPDSSSELDILYHQISECLEHWPAKKSQNYFELKHHFQLLHILKNENYKGEAFLVISKRAKEVLAASKTSWSFVKKATVSGDLRDLGYCVDPPKVSFHQSRPFRRGSRLGMHGPIVRRKSQQISHEGKI